MDYGIDRLESADNPLVLFRGIVGSRAYGTQNANSDTDVHGIFVVPSAEYARLAQPPKQVSDERNDRTYYSPREPKQHLGKVSPQISPAGGMGRELGLQGREEGKTRSSLHCSGAGSQAEVGRASPQPPTCWSS